MTERVEGHPARRRLAYGRTVGVGLAAAALTAVGSSRALMRLTSQGRDAAASGLILEMDGGQLPLATTLSMVVLASWGVLLVTRRRFRRGAAVVGALAAVGVLASVVAGWWLIADGLREDAEAAGLTELATHATGWYWLTLVAATGSALASVAAVVAVGRWPEMGSRYDSPTGAGPAQAAGDAQRPLDDGSDLAFWKALDEGRDPTAGPDD